MTNNVHPAGRRAAAKAWAALTLAAMVTTAGAFTIASAQTAHPDKVKNCATSTPCVGGNNTSTGAGVSGTSKSYYGVVGTASGSDAGVGGFNTDAAQDASGIYGQSENGYGVYGFSVIGSYGLVSQGNAFVSGEIYTGGACKSGCAKSRFQASFAAHTSQPTIDDMGEATLRYGVAHVAIAADFANKIDATRPYMVLLTPEGDASLFVTNRTAIGFDVRQVGGGRA